MRLLFQSNIIAKLKRTYKSVLFLYKNVHLLLTFTYNVLYRKNAVTQQTVRGDIMAVCSAAMPSYTYAMKGEKLLKARGFSCEVKRNEKISSDGCGFSLYIYANCKEAVELLDKYSIPYTGIS